MGWASIRQVALWKLPPSAKVVLLMLAYHRNEQHQRCDPSMLLLAKETGLCRSAVIRAVATLERLGAVWTSKRHGARTRYTIPPYWPSRPEGPVADQDQSPTDTRSGRSELPKPIKNRQGGAARSATPARDAFAESVFEDDP